MGGGERKPKSAAEVSSPGVPGFRENSFVMLAILRITNAAAFILLDSATVRYNVPGRRVAPASAPGGIACGPSASVFHRGPLPVGLLA